MMVVIDGRQAVNKSALHDLLMQQLELPSYYGQNLDALYDLLTERRTPTEITVTHWQELELSLGMYAAALMDTLYDAERDNPAIKIQVK